MKRKIETIVSAVVGLNPLTIFTLLSVIVVMTYGVSLYLHTTYNLSVLGDMKNLTQDDRVTSYSTNFTSFVRHYNAIVLPFMEYGLVVFVTAILVKLVAFTLVYKIAALVLHNSAQAIAVSLLFLLSPTYITHGVVLNGLWGAPLLFGASLSALASLLGLLLFWQQRYVLSGVAYAISIQLHPLYGATFIAWLGIGTLAWAAVRFKWREWVTCLFAIMPVVGSVLYIVFSSISIYPGELLSLPVWYQYIYSIDRDDVSLIFSLELAGVGLVPIILLGTYSSWFSEKKCMIDYFMLGAFVSFLLFLLIELLHRSGIFLGALSEYFLMAQLRRGIWIAGLLALISIVKGGNDLLTGLGVRAGFFLVGSSIAVYLAPSVVTITFLLIYMMHLFRSRATYVLFGLTILLVGWKISSDHLNLIWVSKTLVMLLVALGVIYAVSFWSKGSRHIAFVSVFTIVFAAYVMAGFAHGRFEKSYRALISEGLFEKTNHAVAHQISNSRSGKNGYDGVARACISEHGSSGNKIQLPPSSLTNQDRAFYGHSLIVAPTNIVMPMFSRVEHSRTIGSLKLLLGDNTVDDFFARGGFFDKRELLEFIESQYNALPVSQLKGVHQKGNLRFYLTKNARPELEKYLLCTGDLYQVYDLAAIE